MRAEDSRHKSLGPREDEAASYDAVRLSDAAVRELSDDTLKKIAQELVTAVWAWATIDWNLKDSVRAAMRTKVRRMLAKHDYPPGAEAKAIELVLEQAEVLAREETA